MKSSDRKSQTSSPKSSEHNIWEHSPNLQKEFQYSISKAMLSQASEELSSSEKIKESLTVKTVQIEKNEEMMESDPNVVITNKKRKNFLKSKTLGQ